MTVTPRASARRSFGRVPLTMLQCDLRLLAEEARARERASLEQGDPLRARIYADAAVYYDQMAAPREIG